MPELVARDLMRRGVVSLMRGGVVSGSPETSLDEVARIMGERDVSAFLVVEQGTAVGLVARADLVDTVFARNSGRHWRRRTARELMSAPVVSIAPDTPVSDALAQLRHRRTLVVTQADPGGPRPVGILLLGDVERALNRLA
jgi:CBS domain-containing protein